MIVDCYKKMSKVELNRFTQFVESPYFSTHTPTKKLHYYLLKLFPDFEENKLLKEKVFKAVFSKEKFNEQRLKDVNFQLLKLFEQFLINENLKENHLDSDKLLLQKCKEKGLDKLFKRRIKDSLKWIEKEKLDYNINAYYKFIFHDFAYEFEELKGDRINSDMHLQKRADSLDKFYLTEKMILGAVMLNRQNQLHSELKLNFFDTVSKFIEIEKDFFSNEKAILVNKHLYELQKNENESEYKIIKELIYKNPFTDAEKRLYYTFLRNYCIISSNQGKSEFLTELLELNKKIIEEDLLLYNNELSEWTYKNFIAVGLRLKEFKWTNNFIEKYSTYLANHIAENAKNYNLANLHYAQSNYTEALNYLLQTEFTDLIYTLSSKALLLKIYYETNEFEALDSLLHAFRLYVMRQKKIATKSKDVYLNLVRISESLLKHKQIENTYTDEEKELAIKKIKIKIDKANSLANKTWLLEKVKEFKV